MRRAWSRSARRPTWRRRQRRARSLPAPGGRWCSSAAAAGTATPARRCKRFAEANELPVACAFRHQHLFDNRHPNYAGDVGIGVNPALAARIRDADVLLVIGERLGEISTSGYTLVEAPTPKQCLIHVHPGADELGRVYQPALAIAATPGAFFALMNREPALDTAAWRGSLAAARADLEAWRAPRPVPGALDMWQVVSWLDARLPDDAILTNGAGNYATWLHRLFRYRGFRHAARALLRRDGLRRAGGGRGEGPAPRAHGRLVERRRLLPDERAGARDRGAVRPRGDLRGRRQRHVRDHPDAPGAKLSGARFRQRLDRIRISRRWPAPTARTARPCCGPTSSRRPSSARRPAASPRCCISSWIRRRSRPTPRSTRSGRRGSPQRLALIRISDRLETAKAPGLRPRSRSSAHGRGGTVTAHSARDRCPPPPPRLPRARARPRASRPAVPQVPAADPHAGHDRPARIGRDQRLLLVSGEQVGARRACSTRRRSPRRRGSSSTYARFRSSSRMRRCRRSTRATSNCAASNS